MEGEKTTPQPPQPRKRGRIRHKTTSEKKRRAKAEQKRYRRTLVSLSTSYEAWNKLRMEGKWTNGELASHLLDIHAKFCRLPSCKHSQDQAPVTEHESSEQAVDLGFRAIRPRPSSEAVEDVSSEPPSTLSAQLPQMGDGMSLQQMEKSSSHVQAIESSATESPPLQPPVKEGPKRRRIIFSTPVDEQKESASFPSDISALEDSSDDEDDEDIQELHHSDDNSGLEQSFLDDEVLNFSVKFPDGQEAEELTSGRLTPDCSVKEAVTWENCIASVPVLEGLVKKVVRETCPTKGCTGRRKFRTTKRGSCAVILWDCPECTKRSASGSWASQPRVGGMYAGNLMFHAALLLSGNNERKVSLMCQFSNLWCPSSPNFYRLQRLYFSPVICDYWEESRKELLKGISNEVVLAGDGRMDSPGHSAQFCTYSLMDHDRKCVLTLQCVDVREAKHSYDLERVGFMRAMEDMIRLGVNVREVVTDAHSQIKSIMRTHELFKTMTHQIDIWHASKSLMKKLSAAAKKKHCEVLQVWMTSIRNHFWYASRTCEGDETKLKVLWSTVGQHVLNKHTWLDVEGYTDGGCDHGQLPEEHSKPWLQPNSHAHYELLGIIFDKRLMKSMPYYKNFRHTSYLESFHNHVLMYASKRYSFGYDGYATRNRLAAIDFNHHRDRANAFDADGNPKLQAKFSKATKQWHSVPVKEAKDYGYITDLMERIIQARVNNPCRLDTQMPMQPDHPRRIRPRVTTVPKPSDEELRARHQSRFANE